MNMMALIHSTGFVWFVVLCVLLSSHGNELIIHIVWTEWHGQDKNSTGRGSLWYTDFVNASIASDARLRSFLFNSTTYNNKAWPVYHPNGSRAQIVLQVDAPLRQIISLNWRSDALMWDPADYDDISIIAVSPNEIWIPDLYLENDIRDSDRDLTRYDALLTNDGNVSWSFPMIYKSTCEVDVGRYPFDVQVCQLRFASWSYDSSMMMVTNMFPTVDTSNYLNNSEWRLLELNVRRHQHMYAPWGMFDTVAFNIVLQRMPMFYIFNLIVPCLLIMLLGFTGFILPSTSGEKISLFITTLLALTVFLLMVADNLPPQSKSVPLISIFFGGTIVLLSLSCVAGVMVENIHFRGQLTYDFPPWAIRVLSHPWVCWLFLPKVALEKLFQLQNSISLQTRIQPLCAVEIDSQRVSSVKSLCGEELTILDRFSTSDGSVARGEAGGEMAPHPRSQAYCSMSSAEDKMEFVHLGWSLMATVMDRLMLFLFVTVTLIFILALLCVAVRQPPYTYPVIQ